MVAQVWCHYAQVRHEKYISKQVQVCFVCAWCQSKCVICVGSPAGCAWCQSKCVICVGSPARVCVVPVKCVMCVGSPGVVPVCPGEAWNILLSKSSCVIYGSPGVVPLCPGEAFHSYYVYRILHLNLTCKASGQLYLAPLSPISPNNFGCIVVWSDI